MEDEILRRVNERVAESTRRLNERVAESTRRVNERVAESTRRVNERVAGFTSSLGKRRSSEAELEDAPGREERLRHDARKQRDDARKQRDDARKQRDDARKQRDDARKQRDDARKQRDDARKQRDDARKQRDDALKQRDDALKQRDDAQEQLKDAQEQLKDAQEQLKDAQDKLKDAYVLCGGAEFASNEWRRLCSEAQKERNESLKLVWQLRGRDLDDLAEAQLESLLEDNLLAKERIEKMQLRRAAEACVLEKHPDYACPISLAIMRDPVVTDDGQSYERTEIKAWFKSQREANEPLTSPLRAPLTSAQLVPNHSLRRAIEAAVDAELGA